MKKACLPQTDEALARSAAGGDRAAFDEIMRRYLNPLTRFAASRISAEDADDIVQETFLRAYQNMAGFDDRYTLKSWLFTIASRLIISLYRKKRPDRLTSEMKPPTVQPGPYPSDTEWLWSAAAQMGQEYYTVLWLRYQQQMTTDEIAGVMSKSKIGVRVLLHRARNRLAQMIEHEQLASVQVRRSGKVPAVMMERT